MPLFEYECKNCGVIEFFQNRKEKDLKVCPLCESDEIVKLMSAPGGFNFKGQGFYENDYPKKTRRVNKEKLQDM